MQDQLDLLHQEAQMKNLHIKIQQEQIEKLLLERQQAEQGGGGGTGEGVNLPPI